MLIGNYISTDFQEVLPSDNIDYVINKMNELHLLQIPIVKNKKYYGLVDENSLLDIEDSRIEINTLDTYFNPIHIYDYQHIYDGLELMANNNLSIVPVLDKELNYIGCITYQDVIYALNEILGNQDAAIIIVELGIRDNALSQIARIIEAEDTIIYTTAVQKFENSTTQQMTIKLDNKNISAVIASLIRNNYTIKETFKINTDNSILKNRYDLLMNYLDM